MTHKDAPKSFAERRAAKQSANAGLRSPPAKGKQLVAALALVNASMDGLTTSPLLPGLRVHIARLLSFESRPDRPSLLVLVFKNPQQLDPQSLGRLRPLFNSKAAAGFCDQLGPQGEAKTIKLLWHGQSQRYALADAQELPLCALWPLGEIARDNSHDLPLGSRPHAKRLRASPLKIKDPALAGLGKTAALDRMAQGLGGKAKNQRWLRFLWGLRDASDTTRSVIGEGLGCLWTLTLIAVVGVLLALFVIWMFDTAKNIGLQMGDMALDDAFFALVFMLLLGLAIRFLLMLFLRLIFANAPVEPIDESSGGERPRYTLSLWQRIRGWTAQHTPMGNKVRRAYRKRIEEVQQMIARGQIDEALMRAVTLAQQGAQGAKKRHLFPKGAPEVRGKIDFEVEAGDFVSPILSEAGHDYLTQEYNKLAKTLEDKGDFRRAAYVYSKLLGAHSQAIDALLKAELPLDAAQVSLQSGQAPARTIALFYAAGKKDQALALARRSGDFEDLALEAEDGDEDFYEFVIAGWCQDLMATGRWLAALEASEPLAQRLAKSAANFEPLHPLFAWRGECLTKALAESRAGARPARLVARALLMLPWRAADWPPNWLDKRLAGGPDPIEAPQLPPEKEALQAALAASLQEEDARDASEPGTQTQSAMPGQILSALQNLLVTTSHEQADFRRFAQEACLDPYLRHSLAWYGARGRFDSGVQRLMQQVLEATGLIVLREDIAKLQSVRQAPPSDPAPLVVRLPDAPETSDPCRQACALDGQHVALWRASSKLELLAPDGRRLASHWISDVLDLIAVPGSQTLLILQNADGLVRILKLALTSNQISELAIADLRGWSPNLSHRHWMVQLGTSVAALSLPDLLRPGAPSLRLDWQVQIGEGLQTLAFVDQLQSEICWLSIDYRQTQHGLIEHWSYEPTRGRLDTRLAQPTLAPELGKDWSWFAYLGVGAFIADGTWRDALEFYPYDAKRATALVRRLERLSEPYLPASLSESFYSKAPFPCAKDDATLRIFNTPYDKDCRIELQSQSQAPLRMISCRHQPEACAIFANERGQVAAVWIEPDRVLVL